MVLSILNIGSNCPKCGSSQFSISAPDADSPMVMESPPGVLGVGDCRSCQEEFFVKLSPNHQNAVLTLFRDNPETMRKVQEKLFP